MVNTPRGDLDTSQTLAQSSAAIAGAIVDFLTANRGEGPAAAQATTRLAAQQQLSMDSVGALAQATGYGDVAEAYRSAATGGAGGGEHGGGVVLPGGVVVGSAGAERVPDPSGYGVGASWCIAWS